jgi:Flp pilus assembly pilin Flp
VRRRGFFEALRRLVADQCGASVTELALIAPVLTLFVTGAIDLGEGLSARFSLQQSVNRSLEILQAGPVQGASNSDQTDFSYLINETATTAGVPASQVTMRQWLECDNVPKSRYDDTCDAGQETARYLQLRVNKTFQAHFFLGAYPISAEASVRIQ